jgi:acetoin utilization deacetylase AcuC-like enzyme
MVYPPRMIAAEIYRGSSYGPKHPLGIPRVSLVVDMVHALGWVDATNYVVGPVATPLQLARFHAPDYIAAVMQAERDQCLPDDMMDRYKLGKNGNPIYPASGDVGWIIDFVGRIFTGWRYRPSSGGRHPSRARGRGIGVLLF